MKVWKFKKRIEIDKRIGNFHIETFHYGSRENDKPKHWAELECWYECDCEHCPLSWEVRNYDDVDCGCYMAEYGDFPKTDLICMLPRWIKKILLKRKKESEDRLWEQQQMEFRQAINNLHVINASDIKSDDEWMQEDVWDEIYEKESEIKE